MAYWTPRISARARLAEALIKLPERAGEAGLVEPDFKVIAEQGRAAEAADREQREQLTEASGSVTLKRSAIDDVIARETGLRDLAPAVVEDLEQAGHEALALFLARASFARYRIRQLSDTPAGSTGGADSETVKRLERTEREDMPTRMDALSAFCNALLAESRAPIVDAFAARRLDRAALQKLSADAKALAEAGRNVMTSVEATKRESDAVRAQQKKWRAVRRLLRKAVQGSPELERLWSEC